MTLSGLTGRSAEARPPIGSPTTKKTSPTWSDAAASLNVKSGRAVARIEDHPLPGLVRAGVRCTISTDSPTVAGTTLTEEYRVAHQVLGLTLDELRALDRTARDARFDR